MSICNRVNHCTLVCARTPTRKKNKRLTASDDRVFGTAIRASLSSDRGSDDISHSEKVQKFMVLISSMYSSQGFGLSSAAGSTGSVFASESSSASRSCQTMSLLSLPCLQQTNKQKIFYLAYLNKKVRPRCVAAREAKTYVMSLSVPQPPIPSRTSSWALHTARGLMIVRSQTTTNPSASPVTSRSLLRTNAAACTCALCPRRMERGWAGCAGTGAAEVDILFFFFCVCVYGSSPVKRVSGEDLLSPSLRISSIRGSSVDKYLHGS